MLRYLFKYPSSWIFFGVLVDQLTKYLAIRHLFLFQPKVISPLLEFHLVLNTGAAYGIMQNQRFFLIMVSLLVMVFCLFSYHLMPKRRLITAGLVILNIGAMGNFLDRFFRGFVIDFINIHLLPVFNIADICITLAAGVFIIDMFRVDVLKIDEPE